MRAKFLFIFSLFLALITVHCDKIWGSRDSTPPHILTALTPVNSIKFSLQLSTATKKTATSLKKLKKRKKLQPLSARNRLFPPF